MTKKLDVPARVDGMRRPKFVLFVGGVAAGKTTLRRQRCAHGYVHIDAGEMFAELSGRDGGDFPGESEAELEALGSRMATDALRHRKDIAIEVIGDSPEMLDSIAEGLRGIGYEVEAVAVTCDPTEALGRHQHACETDPTYVSAYFTQSFHRRWILVAIDAVKRKE
jgi:hypothetical protein